MTIKCNKKNTGRINKKQPQEYYDLKKTTEGSKNSSKKLKNVERMGKSKWKKQVKKKRKSIEERAKEELINNILISDKRIGERRKNTYKNVTMTK